MTGQCSTGPLTVTPLGEGVWSPYQVVGSDQVLLPHSVLFKVLVGELKSRHDARGVNDRATKPGPVPDDAIKCELTGSFTADTGRVAFSAEITGVLRGAPERR